MRPPLHIVAVRLRCLADPRDDELRKRFANVEWRMDDMRHWLASEKLRKAIGNVTPIKARM